VRGRFWDVGQGGRVAAAPGRRLGWILRSTGLLEASDLPAMSGRVVSGSRGGPVEGLFVVGRLIGGFRFLVDGRAREPAIWQRRSRVKGRATTGCAGGRDSTSWGRRPGGARTGYAGGEAGFWSQVGLEFVTPFETANSIRALNRFFGRVDVVAFVCRFRGDGCAGRGWTGSSPFLGGP